MSSVNIVTTNTVRHTEGSARTLERGPVIRRTNTIHEHVTVPVTVPRPRIEDFNALVVVQNRVEHYS